MKNAFTGEESDEAYELYAYSKCFHASEKREGPDRVTKIRAESCLGVRSHMASDDFLDVTFGRKVHLHTNKKSANKSDRN